MESNGRFYLRKGIQYLIHFGVLTISDRSSKGEREDLSGPALVDEIQKAGWKIILTEIVSDEKDQIVSILRTWSADPKIDVILTSGGTGFSKRDITPEATLEVVEKLTPGISETMRTESLRKTPHAMLSRAVSGISGETLIINLPGSPKAAVENARIVFPILEHAIELLKNKQIPDSHHQHPKKDY